MTTSQCQLFDEALAKKERRSLGGTARYKQQTLRKLQNFIVIVGITLNNDTDLFFCNDLIEDQAVQNCLQEPIALPATSARSCARRRRRARKRPPKRRLPPL